MNIITLECPSCAAQLQINPKLKKGVCNFCGSPFYIDDEKYKLNLEDTESVGYNFEKGRLGAQNDGADPELIQAVHDLIEPVCGMDALLGKSSQLSDEIRKTTKSASFLQNATGRYLPAAAGTCMVFLVAVLYAKSAATAGAWIGGILFSAAVFAAIYFLQPFYTKQLEDKIVTMSNELEETQKEIGYFRSVLEQYDINIIPKQYRYREAMTFIHQSLERRRAVTIQQAVNLYEEELRLQRERELKERELALQEEQLALQKEQMEKMQEMEEEQRASRRNAKLANAATLGAFAVGGAMLTSKSTRKAAGKVAGSVLRGIIDHL